MDEKFYTQDEVDHIENAAYCRGYSEAANDARVEYALDIDIERGVAYDDGYNDGYRTGYTNGHDDGTAKGHSAGYHEGFSEGYEEGYENAEYECGEALRQVSTRPVSDQGF